MSHPNVIDSLRILRREIPELARILRFEDEGIEEWSRTLDVKLFPRVDPDFPLVTAICGGGSSGKSTLFNAIMGSRISPTGGRSGINRRILIGLNNAHVLRKDFLLSLYDPFKASPEPLTNSKDIEHPGKPLYATSPSAPDKLILLDTPDFDTGSKGTYVNRKEAQNAFETADIFIYIFTNSNYNNRDNTDFISRMLTDIGQRKAILVYRAYPSFSDTEVLEHAMTVARNIYGEAADNHVLGIYRVHEDNAVASGEALPSLRQASIKYSPFRETLDALNRREIRQSILESVQTDARQKGESFFNTLCLSAESLSGYLSFLEAFQEAQVRQALTRFPADLVMKRFIEIWLSTDPPLVRVLRKTGRVVEAPFKLILKAAYALRQTPSDEKPAAEPSDFQSLLESSLLHAAHEVYSAALSEEIPLSQIPSGPGLGSNKATIKTSRSAAHPVIFSAQTDLNDAGWPAVRDSILSEKETIMKLSAEMDKELEGIAHDFRKKMGVFDRMRQSFSAALNILPATLAVTYILHTGDPVGAVGIKVKLASLLGVKDLYALLAIPATAGLKSADMKQLQEMLSPLAQTWFTHKHIEIFNIFTSHITSEIFKTGKESLKRAKKLINNLKSYIQIFK